MHKIGSSEMSARRNEIGRAVRNNQYEETDTGIFLPRSGVFIGGAFEVEVNGKDRSIEPNIVTNAGMNHLLGCLRSGFSAITTWYVSPFSGNVTPVVTQVAASWPTDVTEFTAYTSATRVEWASDAVASQAIANDAVRASFTINGGGGTVWGAGITSSNVKSPGTAGTLFAYSKFSAARVLILDDVLTIKYTISATST